MSEYRDSMRQADQAVVFYSNHALELKRMPPLPKENVLEGFGKKGSGCHQRKSRVICDGLRNNLIKMLICF